MTVEKTGWIPLTKQKAEKDVETAGSIAQASNTAGSLFTPAPSTSVETSGSIASSGTSSSSGYLC